MAKIRRRFVLKIQAETKTLELNGIALVNSYGMDF